MIWIKFFISASMIIASGIQLTRYADLLSDRLNICKVWIGVILLGIVTSLPEAIASLTAVVSLRAPDLAVGNLLGSCNLNLMIIVILDLFYRKGPVMNAVNLRRSHQLLIFFATSMLAVVGIEIGLGIRPSVPVLDFISLGSLALILLYLGGIRKLYQEGLANVLGVEKKEVDESASVLKISGILFVSAALVVANSIWIANICDTIALTTGLGRTFVGSLFLAFVTSLPEIVVSLSALKIMAFDLAIGNIFGSNMINLFIVSLCDVFYKEGPILSVVSKTHLFTVGMGIVLTGLIFLSAKGKQRSVLGLGTNSFFMLVLFLLGVVFLYNVRTGVPLIP